MTSKSIKYILALIVLFGNIYAQESPPTIHFLDKEVSLNDYKMVYEIGNWDHPDYKNAFESNGNHRIVIEVEGQPSIVQVKIPWRRRDDNPHGKDILIIDAKTNAPVKNKHVIENKNAFGHLIFEPNPESEAYYVYYLPHASTGSYYPKLHYRKPTTLSDASWYSQQKLTYEEVSNLPSAKIISAQSIDDFHSFFPMEVIATSEEVADFTSRHSKPYFLFPEYRERSIKMQDYLPVHWVKGPNLINGLSDHVLRGEYYTFQIGAFSPDQDLRNIKVVISDFEGISGIIPKELISSFNTEGVDLNGKAFTTKIDVTAGEVQALWFGVEIPPDTKPGSYMSQVVIQPEGLQADTIYIKLLVSSEIIANYGDDAPENMSRLRWLNSTIGTSKDDIIKPFEPVSVANKTLKILGREIVLNEYGLPEKISSHFTQEMTRLKDGKEEILALPMRFEILTIGEFSEEWKSNDYNIIQDHSSAANWQATNSSDYFTMQVNGVLEYDGMLDYKITVVAKKDVGITDMRLNIPLEADAARYLLGLGFKGGELRQDIKWNWDIEKHQEGVWLGGVNKGLQYVLRDENYERPLNTNFYHNKPLNLPPSWYNDGKGGINITAEGDIVNVGNYSGPREVRKGDTFHFNIRFLITPFKLLDPKTHFSTRFVHKYVPVDSVLTWNGTIVNVHHANEINPYINYPFYNVELQKAYIEEAHHKGVKVKLYNTIRELTYKAHELFAFKSLGTEILNDGDGGGHSWLQEHFKANYHSAWHATTVNDAAILNKGNSRWTNYYIEGINWLAKNQEIDGLYLDDIAFSRNTVKRLASVFDEHRESFVIDLHSANQYNNRDGFTNSAFLYMEHFPYISRLWFGGYFEYDLAPDYWLTEVSGIPFGLFGEMLEKGGHPYRGLVYGMTTRVYGTYNPQAIWQLFDEFDIANSEMLGYWVDRSPIKTDTKGIKSTIYLHKDKVLIAIGSWSDEDVNVELLIDWEELGIDSKAAKMYSPEVDGLQKFATYQINDSIPVPKSKGLILIIEPL